MAILGNIDIGTDLTFDSIQVRPIYIDSSQTVLMYKASYKNTEWDNIGLSSLDWSSSEARSYCQTAYNSISSTYKSYILPYTTVYMTSSSATSTCTDYFWLPSQAEIKSSLVSGSYATESKSLTNALSKYTDYIADKSYGYSWTRTRDFSYVTPRLYIVAGGPYYSTNTYDNSYFYYPCFILSSKQKVTGTTIEAKVISPPTSPVFDSIPSSAKSGSSLTLTWSEPTFDGTSLDHYALYYSLTNDSSSGPVLNLIADNITENSYSVTIPSIGTSLYYILYAIDDVGLTSSASTSGVVQIVYNSSPTVPSSITVPSIVDAGDSIDISFGGSTDEDENLSGYRLYRSTDSGSNYTLIYSSTNTSATSFSYTDSTDESVYSVIYRVCAYDSEGDVSDYRTSSVVTVNHAPSVPASISVPTSLTAGNTITIIWGTSTDTENNLSGYKLERSIDGGASYSQIYSGTATSYSEVCPTASSVIYRVKAFDERGLESEYKTGSQISITVTQTGTPPTVPGAITISSKSTNFLYEGESIIIKWAASTDTDGDLLGYRLERSINGGSVYTEIYVGSANNYTDTIPTGITSIIYRVRAYDNGNNVSNYTSSGSKSVTSFTELIPDSTARNKLTIASVNQKLSDVPVGNIIYVRSNRQDKNLAMCFMVLAQNYESVLNGNGRTLLAWIGNDSIVFNTSALDTTYSSSVKAFDETTLYDYLNTTIMKYLKTWCDNSFTSKILETKYNSWNSGASTAASKIFTLSETEFGVTIGSLGYSEGSVLSGALYLAGWLAKQYGNGASYWTRTPAVNDSSSPYKGIAASMSAVSTVDYKFVESSKPSVDTTNFVIPVFTVLGSSGYIYRGPEGTGYLVMNDGTNSFAPNPAYIPSSPTSTGISKLSPGEVVWIKSNSSDYEDIPVMLLRKDYEPDLNITAKDLFVMIDAWPLGTTEDSESPNGYALDTSESSTPKPYIDSTIQQSVLASIYNLLLSKYDSSVIMKIQNVNYDSENNLTDSDEAVSKLLLLSPEELGCATYNGPVEGDSIKNYASGKAYYSLRNCLVRKYGYDKSFWTRTISTSSTAPYSGIVGYLQSSTMAATVADSTVTSSVASAPHSITVPSSVIREVNPMINISWTAPTSPSGVLQYYILQLNVEYKNDSGSYVVSVNVNTTQTSFDYNYDYNGRRYDDELLAVRITAMVSYKDINNNVSSATKSSTINIYDNEIAATDELSTTADALILPVFALNENDIGLKFSSDLNKIYLANSDIIEDDIGEKLTSPNLFLDECEFILRDANMREMSIIENFDSMIWTERCKESGDFELTMRYSEEAIKKYLPGYYITFNKDKEHGNENDNGAGYHYRTVMRIQDISITWDADEGAKMIVKGESIQSILKQRILTDFGESSSSSSNPAWYTSEKIKDMNIIDFVGRMLRHTMGRYTTNALRKITVFNDFAIYNGLQGEIKKNYMDNGVSWYGASIYEVIQSLLTSIGVNFDVRWGCDYLDHGGTFYVYFYLPEDKSATIIYDPEFGNLSETSYAYTSSESSNVAYVFGNSASSSNSSSSNYNDLMNSTREVIGDNNSGLNRREVCCDVRNSVTPSYDSNNNPIIDSEYHSRLQNYGKDYVEDNKPTYVLDGTLNETTIKGGLGNIVTVADAYGHTEPRQITEIIYTVDEDGVSCYPTFVEPVDYTWYDIITITDKNYINSWFSLEQVSEDSYGFYPYSDGASTGIENNNVMLSSSAIAKTNLRPIVYLKNLSYSYYYYLGDAYTALAKILEFKSEENLKNDSYDRQILNRHGYLNSSLQGNGTSGQNDYDTTCTIQAYYKSTSYSGIKNGQDVMQLRDFRFKFLGTRVQPPSRYIDVTDAAIDSTESNSVYTINTEYSDSNYETSNYTQYAWYYGSVSSGSLIIDETWYPTNTGVNSSVSTMTITPNIDLTNLCITWGGQSENADKFSIWTQAKDEDSRTYLYGPSGNVTAVLDQQVTIDTLKSGTILGFTYLKDTSIHTGHDRYYFNITYSGSVDNPEYTTWYDTYGQYYSKATDK